MYNSKINFKMSSFFKFVCKSLLSVRTQSVISNKPAIAYKLLKLIGTTNNSCIDEKHSYIIMVPLTRKLKL